MGGRKDGNWQKTKREAEKEIDGLCGGGRKSSGPGCGRRECKMEDDNEKTLPPLREGMKENEHSFVNGSSVKHIHCLPFFVRSDFFVQ